MNASSETKTGAAAVFCTACVESDPHRYQAWIDYYTRFFAGSGVHLYLYNDGPLGADLLPQGVRFREFTERLGRQSVFRFPGWKRSFSQAVKDLSACYRWIGHVESDCGIAPSARAEFLACLHRPGYRMGFSSRYNFPETGLQILNTDTARTWFCARYADPASFDENVRIESVVEKELQPDYFLRGDRYEGNRTFFDPQFDYLCQCPLDQFCVLFGIDQYRLSSSPLRDLQEGPGATNE